MSFEVLLRLASFKQSEKNKKAKEIYEMWNFIWIILKMKVSFIKMKKRSEKKKHFLKDKEEIMRICSATIFQAMLDHNVSSNTVSPFYTVI